MELSASNTISSVNCIAIRNKLNVEGFSRVAWQIRYMLSAALDKVVLMWVMLEYYCTSTSTFNYCITITLLDTLHIEGEGRKTQ